MFTPSALKLVNELQIPAVFTTNLYTLHYIATNCVNKFIFHIESQSILTTWWIRIPFQAAVRVVCRPAGTSAIDRPTPFLKVIFERKKSIYCICSK